MLYLSTSVGSTSGLHIASLSHVFLHYSLQAYVAANWHFFLHRHGHDREFGVPHCHAISHHPLGSSHHATTPSDMRGSPQGKLAEETIYSGSMSFHSSNIFRYLFTVAYFFISYVHCIVTTTPLLCFLRGWGYCLLVTRKNCKMIHRWKCKSTINVIFWFLLIVLC